jgi:Protein of unknown function (DUF3795)
VNEDDQIGFTAYCGLFCRDCIPSQKRLFETIRELSQLASTLRLDKYAELKAHNNPSLKDYAIFERVLTELAGLECQAPCRHGGGKAECVIRDCAQARGFAGCWECSERPACNLLAHLKSFHGATIDSNLDTIKECGINDWSDKRGKHYPWSQDS